MSYLKSTPARTDREKVRSTQPAQNHVTTTVYEHLLYIRAQHARVLEYNQTVLYSLLPSYLLWYIYGDVM